jgi:hypothetical protein
LPEREKYTTAVRLSTRPDDDPLTLRCLFLMWDLVLFIADLFHPVDEFSVECFLNGDMGHAVVAVAPCQCFSCGGHHTTSPRPNFQDRTSPALHEAATRCYDEVPAQRMKYATRCGRLARTSRWRRRRVPARVPGAAGRYVRCRQNTRPAPCRKAVNHFF